MATKLFLRNTQNNGLGATYFDMVTAAGAAAANAVVNSAASGTEIQWTQTAGGAVIQFISGRAPAGGFTLTNTDISIWAAESNAQANAGGRYRVFKRTAAGVETEIGGGPFNDGVEFGTVAAEMTWAGNVTDTAFAENDRILVKLYITNIGTMGSGRTCTLTYNAADAGTGDSFFNIAETVAFKSETITGSVGMASEADTALGRGSARPVGLEVETAVALALTAQLIRTVGLASEGDTAGGLGSARSAGMSSDAETAVGLAGRVIASIGAASEADAGFALGSARPSGVALETDTAQAAGAARPIGLASESDTAQQLASIIIGGVGVALSGDSAQALPGAVIRIAGAASETDAAAALGAVLIRNIGLAGETSQALALGVARPIGLAMEADEALNLSTGLNAPVGIASEVDTAQALGSAMLLGMGVEGDAAEALSGVIIGPVGMAGESDAAFTLTPAGPQIDDVGRADETDSGLTLAVYPCPTARWVEGRREPRAAAGQRRRSRSIVPNLQLRSIGG